MSTALAPKVDELKRYIEAEMDGFLNSKSINTAKSYRSDLNQFFLYMYKKEAKYVTVEDLAHTTGSDIVAYKNELENRQLAKGKKGEKKETKQKGTTTNRKIKSVCSFFKYMEADYSEVRSAIFNKVDKAKEHDKRGWGELTLDEVYEMVERVKRYDDGHELSILFEVAFITAIRLDALLTATYEENIFHRQEDGKNIWTIEVIDKDQLHVKSISDELKMRIDSLGRSKDERIFRNLHDHKVGDAIRNLVDEMDIDTRRNIRFHSFKKASVNYVLDVTGDIKQAQKQGNHKSAMTTLESYVKRSEKLADQPSLHIGKEVDISPLSELSHEDLLKLIEMSSVAVKSELLRNLNK